MNKKVFEDDLISGMEKELVKQAFGNNPDLSKAAECLHSALEIFEEQGLKTHADQLLKVMLKIAQTPQPPLVTQTPSMQSLMHAGLTQRDMHEFSKGNPIAKAKFNLVLRSMGMSEHEIGRLIGPGNVMSEDKAKQAINPNSFKIDNFSTEPGATQKDSGPLDFKSVAQKADYATKGLTPEKEVKNLKEFGVPLNISKADDDLMNADVEDSLEVFDADTGIEDFEDERDVGNAKTWQPYHDAESLQTEHNPPGSTHYNITQSDKLKRDGILPKPSK